MSGRFGLVGDILAAVCPSFACLLHSGQPGHHLADAALRRFGERQRPAARTLQLDTLPRINVAAEDLVRKTRTLDRVLQLISDQPQSLVFGAGDPTPGPGERGFSAPEARR